MNEQTLISNPDRMYRLVKNSGEEYVLYVVCGSMAMYEAKIILTPEEVALYEGGGKEFVDGLASDINKNTHAYQGRMI